MPRIISDITLDLADLSGQNVTRHPRKSIRLCKICRKMLSMYNKNRYCYSHSQEGLLADIIRQDRKIARAKVLADRKGRKKWNSTHYLKRKANGGRLQTTG